MTMERLKIVRGNSVPVALPLYQFIYTQDGSVRREHYTPTENMHVYVVNGSPSLPDLSEHVPFPPPPPRVLADCHELSDDAFGCSPFPFVPGGMDCDDDGPCILPPCEEDRPFLPPPPCGCGAPLPWRYEITDWQVNNHILSLTIPGTLPLGLYHFELTDEQNGQRYRGVIEDCFEIVESSFESSFAGQTGYDYQAVSLGSVTFLGQDAPTRAQFEALQQALADGLADVNERIDEITVQAVQADWEENDPTSPSYIRNRTHYVRGREAEWTANVSLSGNYGTVTGVTGITIGKRYDVEVRVGNQLYSYTALLPKTDDEGHYYVSERWDITASPQNPTGDDSFYIWNVDNTVYVGFSFLQNVSAEVTLYDSDVKRLDRQFMPDGVAWEVTQADIDEITGKI